MSEKNVLITGASHGIGKAIARYFAQQHCNLVLNCFHDIQLLKDYAAELSQTYGIVCLAIGGDIASFDFVTELFSCARKKLGSIDILINNAGISYIGLLTDMNIQDWNQVISTNLTSVFSCCRMAIPDMVHKKEGKILNISSVWGVCGASCEVAYSASKSGVHGFTRALAKELAPSNIQVNAIACGVIDTRMNQCFSPEERQELEQEIPSGRYGTPDEVAALAWELCSGHAYLTGQVITLDGGWI